MAQSGGQRVAAQEGRRRWQHRREGSGWQHKLDVYSIRGVSGTAWPAAAHPVLQSASSYSVSSLSASQPLKSPTSHLHTQFPLQHHVCCWKSSAASHHHCSSRHLNGKQVSMVQYGRNIYNYNQRKRRNYHE